MSKKFTADFETITNPDDCRVWAYSICEIGDVSNFTYGNNIDDFMKYCENSNNATFYFHNLKFDGEFIFQYLLKNGYECIKDKKDKKDKTFTTLISDMGQFYSIEVYFKIIDSKHVVKVTFLDSLKILNFSVEKIAKDFHLPISKLSIDYNEFREIGHTLTNEEIEYIKNDVEIMARSLEFMFSEKLTKMTIGSNALSSYKKLNKNFSKYFPILAYEIDQDIRKSYKGGFTYLSPKYENIEVSSGSVFDVNSLYPSVMYYEEMPFGQPIPFTGKYEEDKLYKLYIQCFTCSFKIKENKIPTIQLKNTKSFMPNEYIESSDDELVTLTLTNVDLKLFFEQYDVKDITYHSGWKFKAIKGMFCQYIDKYTEIKIKSKKDDNGAMYLIAKLMLNSLYGKFGLNPNVRGKYPVLIDDIIKYKLYEKEIREPIYIPVASFITAYARKKTIETSQKIRDYSLNKYGVDKYIYSDTDSIHCLFENDDELKNIIDIDDYKLGYWKHESTFTKAKFLRQKCYIELMNIPKKYVYKNKKIILINRTKLNVTVAGLPKKLSEKVTFENFEKNFTVDGKLTFKHVKGGVILENTTFTIK